MIPTFITVRTSSVRLPKKCLLPLGDCNVLEHVIRRCKHFEFRPIVCTTNNPEDAILVSIAQSEEVEFYCGNINPQSRWIECAGELDAFSFHAIDCDDPYFDPLEVERSYSYMNDLHLRCVLPTKSSENDALGMMGTSMSLRSGETKILPERRSEEELVRMTLDYPEDYWFLSTVARLGAKPETSRNDVNLIACHPIKQINLFRTKEWKERQIAESSRKV